MNKQNKTPEFGIKRTVIKKTIAISAIMVAAVVFTVVYEIGINNFQAQTSSVNEGTVEVQWMGYPQLDNLTSTADVIVVGKVVTDKGEVTGSLPQTDFGVNIEQVLKGNFKPDDNITVRQVGSRSANGGLDTDVMMNVGDRYLFFLGYSHTAADVYYSVGGPQGRFPIQSGMINSMDQIDPKAYFVHVKEKNKPLDDFITEISAKIKEAQSK